jgi:hypothetical protein
MLVAGKNAGYGQVQAGEPLQQAFTAKRRQSGRTGEDLDGSHDAARGGRKERKDEASF